MLRGRYPYQGLPLLQVCVLLCTANAFAQAPAPAPLGAVRPPLVPAPQPTIASAKAPAPAPQAPQVTTVVSGSSSPTANTSDHAYVAFRTVVPGITLSSFGPSSQTQYLSSIAAAVNVSATQVQILRISSGSISVAASLAPVPAPGPAPGATKPLVASAPAPSSNSGRRLLQTLSQPLYIYTAITVNISGVNPLRSALKNSTTPANGTWVPGQNATVDSQSIVFGTSHHVLLLHLRCC